MQARPQVATAPKVTIDKTELVRAWGLLENLAVSSRKIGAAFATATAAEFTPEKHRDMLIVLGRFVEQSILEDANELRAILGAYLPDDEAEELADRLPLWDQTKQ